jgi:hypothetical protein
VAGREPAGDRDRDSASEPCTSHGTRDLRGDGTAYSTPTGWVAIDDSVSIALTTDLETLTWRSTKFSKQDTDPGGQMRQMRLGMILIATVMLALPACYGESAVSQIEQKDDGSGGGCDPATCNQFCGSPGGFCNSDGYCQCNPNPPPAACCDRTCSDGTSRFCQPGTPGDCAQCADYDCSCPEDRPWCDAIWCTYCDPLGNCRSGGKVCNNYCDQCSC